MSFFQRALITVSLIQICFSLDPLAARSQGGPGNLDFELPLDTNHVAGVWFPPNKKYAPDYSVELRTGGAYKGDQYAEISSLQKPNTNEFGNLMQFVDATPYRGKTVRFRAAVKVTSQYAGQAQLWLRVDRKGRKLGFFDNMGDRPITDSNWKEYEIVGDVDTDAEKIYFGCMLFGVGKVGFDAASFEVVDQPAATNLEPPSPLAGRSLDNIISFAKLYGYVRFFHPTDAVAHANWDNIAINGVKAIESASDATALASALQDFFSPVAPTVRVYRTGTIPETPKELLVKFDDEMDTIAWVHFGVGLGGKQSIYSSKRVTASGYDFGQALPVDVYGGVSQELAAKKFRGKHLEFSAYLTSTGGWRHEKVQLGVFSFEDGKWAEKPLADMRYLPTNSWNQYSVEAAIPEKSDSIRVAARIYSPSEFSIDDASLTIAGDHDSKNFLKNPGFEEMFAGWEGSPTQVFRERPDDLSHTGNKAIKVSKTISYDNPPPFPSPVVAPIYDLGGGVSCSVPIALSLMVASPPDTSTDRGKSHSSIDKLPDGYIPTGDDRATRIADIIITWNVMQHFFPYFDVVKTDWNAALRAGLERAAMDKNKDAFEITLQQMVAKLHDGHGYVSHYPSSKKYAPFAATMVGDKAVVTDLAEGYDGPIHSGDVINSMDGHPFDYWYARIDSITPAGTKQSADFRITENVFAAITSDTVRMNVSDASSASKDISVGAREGYVRFKENRPFPIATLKPGIMYVDLSLITTGGFDSALTQLAAAKAIIFDMRGYPSDLIEPISHIIDSAVTCARWNVPLVMYPDGKDWSWQFSNWKVPPAAPRFTKNIVHLTDGRAVSAAETYMGIIENYHIGEIIGSPTAGTNGNVNPFVLPGKYNVMWTGMKVLKHDGSQHHAIGIHPTIPCTRTIEGIRSGKDEVLDKGIEVAEKMISKNG